MEKLLEEKATASVPKPVAESEGSCKYDLIIKWVDYCCIIRCQLFVTDATS